MIERCGQTFGGMGYEAACRFGQHHRCDLAPTHDDTCVCFCGATPNDLGGHGCRFPKWRQDDDTDSRNE